MFERTGQWQRAIHPLAFLIAGSALILFIFSSIRHYRFESTAYDLAIFDQAIYLISQGKPPFSTIVNYHMLGDHAALILYPLALFYKLYPDVHWLFAVQAIALALGAWPTWALARQAGLSNTWAMTIAAAYLLYPTIFKVNLFDFHPDVMAPAALLGAIFAARSQRIVAFTVAILFVLSLKAVLSLTVVALGMWLFVFEKQRRCGAIAIATGIAWFLIATQYIIPTFSGKLPAATNRYDALGRSPLEIAQNLFLQPQLVLEKIVTPVNFRYVGLSLLPMIWGLAFRSLSPLLIALPTLFLNLLSEAPTQKQLSYQYSLPVLVALVVTAIGTIAAHQTWQTPKLAIATSLMAFLLLLHLEPMNSQFFQPLDPSWRSIRAAIAKIDPNKGVLADSYLVPHLCHRPMVKLLRQAGSVSDRVDYVLLNLQRPWPKHKQTAEILVKRLQSDPRFQLRHQRRQVFLFERIGSQ